MKGDQALSDSFSGEDAPIHSSSLISLDDDGGLLRRHVSTVRMREDILHQDLSDFTKEHVRSSVRAIRLPRY